MKGDAAALATIADETRALLERVARLKPFVLEVPMVLAAGPSFDAQIAIERHLWRGRRELRRRIERFLHWLEHPRAASIEPARAQQGFVALRLAFNVVLDQLDIFAEAMTQRSEAGVGVWLSGLDEVARDALSLPGLFEPPPVLCYLARGPGGAIRRARTRLPGGGDNPVAIIRLPRERMIGSGIASSLVHEVGHQGAALLDLVTSLRANIAARARREDAAGAGVWSRWSRWISEIVADFWAVARIGVASTTGLIGVVSLPQAFVFRDNGQDPHPTPWLRVLLSTAIGDALYPHPQWQRLACYWCSLYPLERAGESRRRAVVEQARSIPALVELLVNHRASALGGRTLAEALASSGRTPLALAERWSSWRHRPHAMTQVPPSLAFAVIGQARAERALSPQAESDLLVRLLEHHAMRGTLDRTAVCAVPRARAPHRINSYRVRQEESHVG
jgi:hypothetical protein